MRRLLMVSALAALMAAMMVVTAAPAMANDWDDGCVGVVQGGECIGVGSVDNDHLHHFGVFNDRGLFDHDNDHRGLFDHGLLDDNDEEDLDTIDVGPLECLVEDGDDVKFCVNEDTGERVHVF